MEGLSFGDGDAVYVAHEFAFDDVFFSSDAFCVFDDGVAEFVAVDEVGYVGACSFEHFAIGTTLWRYEFVGNLFTQIGDKPGSLHQVQFVCASVFFS